MRSLKLTKAGLNKLRAHQKELKAQDLDDSTRGIHPGEWCLLTAQGSAEAWIAHVNPMVDDKFNCVQVLELNSPDFTPEKFLRSKLEAAYRNRLRFNGYGEGARIFYGASDGLSGLIVDLFQNACIVQINSAGIDRYRDFIKTTVSEITGKKAFFLDNPKYREKEHLPMFETEALPDITAIENNLKYHLTSEVLQKIGFYYDHRENRIQLQHLLSRLVKRPATGIDLFCYAGAWGMNALKAGVQHVDFVDQGDFSKTLDQGLNDNNFSGRGAFYRGDVFKFLDNVIASGKKYDLIMSDPPAFAKSASQKGQALDGYSKLHQKVFKVAADQGVLAFSSCTHYVSQEEFQKNILEASLKAGRKIQLLYAGVQGWDHPVASLVDRASYIKSYFYILE